MRRPENQSGFGTVKIVLIVFVLAALAVTGLVLYQHSKPSSAKNSAATSPTQTTTQHQSAAAAQPAQTTAHSLDIKEWGVHMTLDSTTASLYYYISPNLPDVAYLSLRDITSVAPTCAADKGALGAISRLTPAQHQDALSGKIHSIPGSIQIGNYWYGYQGTQADCSDGTAATHAAMSKAAPNYNSSTLQTTFNTLSADTAAN